jgi:hypothetical protein
MPELQLVKEGTHAFPRSTTPDGATEKGGVPILVVAFPAS